MSYSTFPNLTGIKWDIKKRPTWNTAKMLTAAGNEFRTGYRQNPITEFDLSYSYMSLTDKLTMEGFFNQTQGALTPFYFDLGGATQNSGDDTIASAFAFATTVNPGLNYTITKPAGTGAIEPVGAVNTFNLFLDGVAQPIAGLSAPGVATLAQVATGALAATTYYVKCTWLNYWGETLGGTQASLAVSANNVLKVTQPASPPATAVWWNVYVSNTAGGGSGAEKRQTTATQIAIATTTWQEPTTGLAGSTVLPASNTTVYSLTGTPNIVTFPSQPYAGHILSWTGSYYYLVRFAEDVLEFNEIANLMYELQECKLVVVQ